MKYFGSVLILMLAVFFSSCNSGSESNTQKDDNRDDVERIDRNPAEPDFNLAGSDPTAITVADEVMKAMGGRANWDQTRFLGWNFFGRRHLIWDKAEGKVRITTEDMTYLIDIFNDKGKVMKAGEELTHPDSLAKYVERGKNIWINDSYWLVMPFKLKDSGVTLKHLGRDTTESGQPAEILELTFAEVGVTPNNKYWVYVDEKSRLVSQWDYFTNAADEKARLSTPWNDYQKFGDILLSGDRGQRQLTDIAVYQMLPDSVFTTFATIDYQEL